MDFNNHLANARHHIREYRPMYLGYMGGLLGSLLLILISVLQGWYSFIIFGLISTILLGYLALSSIWSAGFLFNIQWIRDRLFDLGDLEASARLVEVCLGRRYIPAVVCRRLTTGHVLVVDIYHPGLTPSQALVRARRQNPFVNDPRITWREGDTHLLPLPDAEYDNAIMIHVATEYWQQGDQLKLFSELHRILKIGGRLLVAERVWTPTSVLTCRNPGLRFRSSQYWESLFKDSNFKILEKQVLMDLICCWQLEKTASVDNVS
jgi:ubiquinone/menaquinone biosynthesis C-methylase UbiE